MTAHEPTPTAEHTDAVARVVAGLLDDFDTVMNVRAESREVARRLLTSTDPAVHLALVDALVRAGVIAEETYVDWCDHEDRDPWEPGQWIKCGQPADHRGEHKDGCSGHRWPRRPDPPRRAGADMKEMATDDIATSVHGLMSRSHAETGG